MKIERASEDDEDKAEDKISSLLCLSDVCTHDWRAEMDEDTTPVTLYWYLQSETTRERSNKTFNKTFSRHAHIEDNHREQRSDEDHNHSKYVIVNDGMAYIENETLSRPIRALA